MSAVPFHYLDLRTFCYATEDEPRVERALRTVLPPETEVDRVVSTGHHSDRILVLSARVETADDMRYVLDRLQRMGGFEHMLEALPDRVDENCSFFVRLDKQRAYHGESALGAGIQVRGKVEAYPASKTGAIDNLESYFASTG